VDREAAGGRRLKLQHAIDVLRSDFPPATLITAPVEKARIVGAGTASRAMSATSDVGGVACERVS